MTLPLSYSRNSDGAGERTRTPDPLITNQMLCQLSYAGQTRSGPIVSPAGPSLAEVSRLSDGPPTGRPWPSERVFGSPQALERWPRSPLTAIFGGAGWLGGRDSNPDKQIQSLPCYRYTTSQ